MFITWLLVSELYLSCLNECLLLVMKFDRIISFFTGNLADTIFKLLLDPVLSAEAITDAASRFVHSLFLDAIRGVAEVFLVGKSITIHPITNPTETSQQIKIAVKYSMLFEKFQCVGQFMAMRLDDITRGLEEGVFRSVTAKELSHLVTATYDESAKRNALLKVLALK